MGQTPQRHKTHRRGRISPFAITSIREQFTRSNGFDIEVFELIERDPSSHAIALGGCRALSTEDN